MNGEKWKLMPCTVHPLHIVRVRADGSRTGCPLCELAVEQLTRRR